MFYKKYVLNLVQQLKYDLIPHRHIGSILTFKIFR